MSFVSNLFGGGGGSTGDGTYYQNIANDIIKSQQAEIDKQQQATADLQAKADAKEAEAKQLQDVQDNKSVIQRSNPIPFMTTGFTGVGRTLGSAYTLG